jgi:hypothetical protein
MKIGVVDLDTSHPQNWIPLERELGHEIVGVWDGGDVHPQGYAEKFAKDHEIPAVFDSIAAMVPEVDCAVIHGCDWDKHIDKARPFVEAGKAVLIDKPMAGSLADLRQLLDWEARGVRVAGGSSLRFCYESRQWLQTAVEERGTPQTVFAGCGVDEYNYGVHAYSLLSALMGPGAESVQFVQEEGQSRALIHWKDCRMAMVSIGETAEWIPFYATVVTERGVSHIQPDSTGLYRALLETVLPYLAGETEQPPMPMIQLIEPELCAIGAAISRARQGETIALKDITEEDTGYNGAAFAKAYKKMRGGK